MSQKLVPILSCSYCNYFGDRNAVRGLIVAHHIEKARAPFFCVVCQATFQDCNSWIQHERLPTHRAKAATFPDRPALGRGDWELVTTGDGADAVV